MKKFFLVLTGLTLCVWALADSLVVDNFKFSGYIPVFEPFKVDSTDINGKVFDIKSVVKTGSFEALKSVIYVQDLPQAGEQSIGMIGFCAENRNFTKAKLEIKGLKSYQLYIDGKESEAGDLKLEPASHEFALRFLRAAEDTAAFGISFEFEKEGALSLREDGKHILTAQVNEQVQACVGALSASGKYLLLTVQNADSAFKKHSERQIIRLKDGKILFRTDKSLNWIPAKDELYYERKSSKGTDLVCMDPETLRETTLARSIPDGYYRISPAGDKLFYTMTQEGPKEGSVHEILNPEDRQSGWRDRSYICAYDISSGVMQQLSFGYNNSYLLDISRDGKKLLMMSSRLRLTKRPTTLFSLYLYDMDSNSAESLVADDGFISGAAFSPDAKSVLIEGSPEALGGIANTLPEGVIPSMTENELFIMNLSDKTVRAITRDFDPNIERAVWSEFDSKIYASCEDRDRVKIYRIDPESLKIELIPTDVDVVRSFDLAPKDAGMVYNGQGLENPTRLYYLNTKTLKQSLLFECSLPCKTDLGKGNAYEFTNRNGEKVNGFYVLPPSFDPNRKYPLLVFYYGGCSPTDRYSFGSAYNPQFYAAQDYIFFVVNPSGATGFGQEWSSRHVNTAGNGVAEDIIDGVMSFCNDHPYVNSEKIGCFSASYGGFMTQLLLAKSDIFAAGVSHAGISDHTGYWGEGYWGYSYSEIAMAGSYPWSNSELFVKNSPLYMADKIHTPLLFTHGSADTNVPPSESIQMFTALKLLGADTAFVLVDGENHTAGSFSVENRFSWLKTLSAWFSKYLKDDPCWWEELYPEKNL